ncbi:tape measure protein [Roseococcus sp. SDR]|uniref:tape measure protein n=1 Tax=Roseococcus sp. SDR TaxID=2835532 RepID=UPI001BCCF78A|nr:tape measure protein [Roseococcus sp. SDR]MBS7790318.1 tape measure protein [Roseococcus sp. SDR]MBV1845632.1 tape measure protein [Roseococcus sp. SDR]
MADATRRVSVRLSLDDAAKVKQGLREVGETGQRSMEQIRDGADRASRALDLLDTVTRAAPFVALAAGIRATVIAGDQLTQSMGRLTTAVGSVERASEVYATLYRDALQTGVAVRDSVDAFQRFSIAAREIGATNEQVVRLVTGLQRVAISSGASTQEIQGSTQQLAQALASGVLQGDELRSILEGLPTLAQALAQELGVSIGELRKMGSEGKLTADVVFPALLRAVERVNTEFERAPLSVGRAYGQLTAAADQFLARLDQAIGLSSTLARALSGAARALDGIRQGAGLLTPEERLADQRRAAEAMANEIARLEALGSGAAVSAQPRRGSIQAGLVGTAQSQAGVDQAGRLRELREQYFGLLTEIEDAERSSLIRRLDEQGQADARAVESRRRRGEQEANDLRRQLDDRFRINQEYEERIRRIRESAEAGGMDAAERGRLEALATRERDEALQRLEGTTRRVAAATRENRDAERETNDIIRERERLIQQNENAYERYVRRLENLGRLVERAERIGQPVPDETIQREAQSALDELEQSQNRLTRATERTNEVGRELGLTFSSAFEDAVVRGKSFSDVLKGIGEDLARIMVRRTITEPLGNAVGSVVGSIGSSFGDWIGGLFRAEGGPVTGGQPYIVGERGPEWFVPDRSGTVLPNGTSPGGGMVVHNSINIDARGADAGVEARLRMMAGQIARQASVMTLDAIRRGGTAYETVRG